MVRNEKVVFIGPVIYELRTARVNTFPETVIEVPYIDHAVGGGAPITAIALSKMGIHSVIVSSVGGSSDSLESQLKSYGVELLAEHHSSQNTDTTITLQFDDGRKALTHNHGSYGLMSPRHLESIRDDIVKSNVIMIQALRGLKEPTMRNMADIFNDAKETSITALDMGAYVWDQRLNRFVFDNFLPNTHLLCGNEKELYGLVECKPVTEADEIERFMTPDRVFDYVQRVF